MNEAHLQMCASPEWRDDVLEPGPGPGLTTGILARQAPRLTAAEADGRLAAQLAQRLGGTVVDAVHADGTTDLLFDAGRFSAATLLTMLHHVPSAAKQDQLLAELRRVLRPGGLVLGTDGIDTPSRRDLHRGVTSIEQDDDRFRFLAATPT